MISSRLVFDAPATCSVETVELPAALGAQEVLVENRLGLVSPGTELAIFTGEHRGFDVADHWAGYPWWPGYCNVGTVVEAGSRVRGLRAGDRVVHEGTHATFARQHAATVVKIPDALGDERAVFFKLLGIAFTTQMVAPIGFGEPAAVLGLGMVGNLAAQLCREAGAWTVHGVDRAAGRRDAARACDLDAGADLGVLDAPQYMIEAVGLGVTVRDAIRATARRGRTIILSSPREKVELDPYFDIHHPAKQVIGTHESARTGAERAPFDAFLLDLLASGRVHVDPLVTHRLPFGSGLQQAYEGLRDDPDRWMGVLIDYTMSQ